MRYVFLCLVCGMLMLMISCGAGEKKPEYDITAQFAELEGDYQDLKALRTRTAEIEEKIAILEDAEKHKRKYKKEDLPEEDPATLQTQLSETQASVEEVRDAFMDKLTMFLNKSLNEYPDAPETKKAVRMYSDENIRVAQDHIDKGGKYKKAIDIYQTALQYDPDYEVLIEKLKKAEEFRFITKERFDKVKVGMTMDEVKEVVGVPNISFIKEYKEKRGTVIAWFYQRDDASAAGFYFHRGKLYNKKWTATKTE